LTYSRYLFSLGLSISQISPNIFGSLCFETSRIGFIKIVI
jgi:hypothetical protein